MGIRKIPIRGHVLVARKDLGWMGPGARPSSGGVSDQDGRLAYQTPADKD